MKNTIVLATILGIGIAVGVFAQRTLGRPTPPPDQWNDQEEDTRRKMHNFQVRLDTLQHDGPDTVEKLTKDMEAQLTIDDILIKFREAQQSKFTPFATAVTTIFGALLGVAGTVLKYRFSQKPLNATSGAATADL